MGRIILAVLRSVLALVVGMIVGAALITLGHFLSMLVFPPPAGLDLKDPQAFAEYVGKMPDSAWVLVILSHAMGPLGGGFVAAWIAGRAKVIHALIVGAFFLVGGIINLNNVPHPPWFAYADLLMYLPVAFVAGMLAPRRTAPATPQNEPYPPVAK
jgi:hypothetical protein